MHGLTHRAVEKEADLPPGTASNYFRSREALLVAAAKRIVELHHADTDRATEQPATLADLLTESLLTAATTLRNRYLAIFELQLEADPPTGARLGARGPAGHVVVDHRRAPRKLGLATHGEKIPALIALYGGALFTLVTAPPGSVSRDVVRGWSRSSCTAVPYR